MKALFKHELKNHFLEVIILSGANIFICLLLGIYVRFFDDDNVISALILSGLAMSLLGVFVATSVVFIVSVIKSFNTKLFSNEGYLTFSLPVALDKIILVKYLVNLLWVIIIGCSYIIGILIIFIILADVQTSEVFKYLVDFVKAMLQSPLTFILPCLNFLVTVIMYFSILFLVLAILNCGRIKKAKFILGLAMFMGMTRVINFVQTISSLFSLVVISDENAQLKFKFVNVFSEDYYATSLFSDVPQILNVNTFVLTIVIGVGLYLLARLIVNRKLELE